MNRVAAVAQGFLNDERGISSVEYAMLLAFLGAGVVLGAEALSSAVDDEFRETADIFGRRCAQVGSNCDGTKN